MTKAQIKVFEDLLATEGFKGKKQLRHILWMNTCPPKYEQGDCLLVSDPAMTVYGYRVKDFKGKVVGVKAFINDYSWHYELECEVRLGDKVHKTTVYATEEKLKVRCDGNVTILGAPKNDVSEALDVALPI